MNSRPIYCWDANVFLAWLGEEASAPLGDIELVIGEIDSGEAELEVPVTAYSEILEAHHTPEQMEKFRKFLQRSNVDVANITQPIAEKAGQARSRALALVPKVKLRTPDATYIATAIVYKASVFHTLEASQLPQLSETPVVDGLKIKTGTPERCHIAVQFPIALSRPLRRYHPLLLRKTLRPRFPPFTHPYAPTPPQPGLSPASGSGVRQLPRRFQHDAMGGLCEVLADLR